MEIKLENRIQAEIKSHLALLVEDNSRDMFMDLDRVMCEQGGTIKFPISFGIVLEVTTAAIEVKGKCSFGVKHKGETDPSSFTRQPDMVTAMEEAV